MSTHNVVLEHAPNGDLYDHNPPGYWQRPTDPQKMIVACNGIADAVNIFKKWRDNNGLGGGNMTKNSGMIHSFYGLVARISYNGRVWREDGSEITPQEYNLFIVQ